jgi:signal transduction histidine kinase
MSGVEELLLDGDEASDLDETAASSASALRRSIHWGSKTVLVVGEVRPEGRVELSSVFRVIDVSEEKVLSDAPLEYGDLLIVGKVREPLPVISMLRRRQYFSFTPIVSLASQENLWRSYLDAGATVVVLENEQERLLAQSQALLCGTHVFSIARSQIEVSGSPIVVVSQAGSIFMMNGAALALLDCSEVEWERLSFLSQVMGSTLREGWQGTVLELLQLAKEKVSVECDVVLTNGKSVPLLVTVSSLVLREGLLFSFLLKDLTWEKKALEERRKQNIESIQTEKMVMMGELASHVAHEINNPLAVVQARIALFRDTLDDVASSISDEGQKELVQHVVSIEKSATRIQRIVRSLYRFSRNEKDEPFEDVLAVTIVQDTLDLCSSRFLSNGVDLGIPAVDSELKVHCRPLQISQILLNFLNNAFDAVATCEEELASEKWVKLDVRRSGDWVEFRVRNGGPRIPEEVVKKVFEAYFTTKPVGKGSGLGLSISQSLAEAHGGQLFVDLEEVTTCFVCRIPLKL